MSMCVSWILLLTGAVFGLTAATPIDPPYPVLNAQPGIRYKPVEPRPKVKLTIFIDLNCHYSKTALPIVQKVSDYYGSDRLDLVVQQLPEPFHRNAFLCTQGLYVIRDQLPEKVFDYMEAVLGRYPEFSTANTTDKSQTEVLSILADVAVASTGIDRTAFINSIGSYVSEVVAVWKYAASNRKAGTRSYLVNDIDLVNADPTFDDWIAFLDPIINS
jgi:hypothetical protein